MTKPQPGPAPKTLRISDIDPAKLGEDFAASVFAYICKNAMFLSPRYEIVARDSGDGSFSNSGETVADLARYARGEGGLDATVEDHVISLFGPLIGPFGKKFPDQVQRAIFGALDVDSLDPESVNDRFALAICAALGRQAMESGVPVRSSWLAASAGVTASYVNKIATSGVLTRDDDGGITADSAKVFLSARGCEA